MKTLHKAALLGTVLAFTITGAATAAEPTQGKKTKEITEIIGYNVTEKIPDNNPRSKSFSKMDKSADGEVTLKEFQNYSNLENGYEVFITMDTDKSKSLSYQEFASYNPTKGNTKVESELHGKAPVQGTNLKSRGYTEKSYFVPTERKIVKEEAIEPAAGN